jgi:hypothetical protein
MIRVQAQGREGMDETKQKQSVYSSESTETTTVNRPPGTTKPTESSETGQTQQFSKQTQTTQMVALPKTRTGGYPSLAECAEFLKRTRHVWLVVAGTIFGLIAVFTLMKRVSEWARNTRERRHEQAVASVTPDRLIARCGQPVEDLTKEVYPILMRTMIYPPKGNEKLVLAFSRTAEERAIGCFYR